MGELIIYTYLIESLIMNHIAFELRVKYQMPELYRKAASRLLHIHHFGVVGEDEELSVPIRKNQ